MIVEPKLQLQVSNQLYARSWSFGLTTMFRNYLKIAVRSLLKHKLYSAINIFGLALGMACALLIGLWVKDELSYDRFLPDADRVFFVRFNVANPNTGEVLGTNHVTPGPLQEAIAKDVPAVAAATKTTWYVESLIKVGEKAAKEMGQYATADFFRVFPLPALTGDPNATLRNPNQIVITRRVAEKFFGSAEQARGKTLQLDNANYYVVGAVIENQPATSSVQFDWVVNFAVQEKPWHKSWGNNSFRTYARLRPGTTPAQAEAPMSGIYDRYVPEQKEYKIRPILQPLTDLHLWGDYKGGKPVGGRVEYVRIFSIVAGFLLLIACINFMNLATARASLRAKEVGVRKVVGAGWLSLVGQFLSESLLLSAVAAGGALALVWSVLPTFNATFEKQLLLDFAQPALWGLVATLVLITGLLSGSYPALFLSALSPVRILKGTLPTGGGRGVASPAVFRRVLVVFQFALSMFLIVGMLAVGRQMNYLRHKNLGLDRENVLYLPLEGEIGQPKKLEAFRQEVMRLPSVLSATSATDLPIEITWTSGDLTWSGKDPKLFTNVSAMLVSADFTRTLNIRLLAGRDFRAGSLADSSNYLVNEAAAKFMGVSNPVGKEIQFTAGKGRIIGLMKDYHLNSLHQAINPLVVAYNMQDNHYLLVKARTRQTDRAIADLERLTRQFNPNYPFTYHFLDEAYEKLYNTEQQVNTLVNYFGILAILISCLGLFALAAFTAEQRTKEIGVRKVLGASVGSIVTLLSKDFLRLVLIALVLATPLAWWAVDKWLGTFAYQTELTWWIFGVAGVLATLVALLTVSYQAIKAALMNPVTSLRSE